MKITPQEVSHVADLARLHMSQEEIEAMARQLDDILTYVAKLNELDTEAIVPTTHAISIVNAFREDEMQPSLDRGGYALSKRLSRLMRPYRTWGYPWPPIVFLLLSFWSLTYMLIDRPWESIAGLATIMVGAIGCVVSCYK